MIYNFEYSSRDVFTVMFKLVLTVSVILSSLDSQFIMILLVSNFPCPHDDFENTSDKLSPMLVTLFWVLVSEAYAEK